MVNYVNTDKNDWTINTETFPVIPMRKIQIWKDLSSDESGKKSMISITGIGQIFEMKNNNNNNTHS
jgi:hypothetical protein